MKLRERLARERQPFKAVHRNVLVGERPAAMYRLDTTSYEFLSTAGKERLHGQLAWFAYSVGADFSLYRVSRAYPAETYVADTIGMVDERHADPQDWERLLVRHARHLERMHSYETEVYLTIALHPRRALWERGPKQQIAALVEAEQVAYDNLLEHLQARRAHTHEIQWLLRRAACRGVAEPELDPNWLPPALTVDGGVYESAGATLIRHAAQITEESRALIVESDEGTSFQSMLALGALPRVSQFPGGAELLFTPLEALNFPVDAVLHARWVDNDDMQKLVNRRVRDADIAAEDAGVEVRSWAVGENRVIARDVHEYFTTEPYPPALACAISFAVGAHDREELKHRIARVRKRFGAVKLHVPFGEQIALYEDHLPRPDGARLRHYLDTLTIEQFGALMPIGTHQAGAQRGVFFAHTVPGAPRPVKIDLTAASRGGQGSSAPSTLLVGALGRGKTVAAEVLLYQAAMRGSQIVDVDPKPDHHLHMIPDLAGRVHVITLSGDEKNRGLLDPLAVAPPALQEDLASDYLEEILPQAPPAWSTQIRRAVKAVLKADDPSCLRVLDLLQHSEHDDARAAGEALEVWADSGLGRLAFGDGSRARDRARLPVTTIDASALKLPPPGVPRADYDKAERMSVATMKLLVGYSMRLVSGDRTAHKVLHFDEAHVLLGAGDGRRLLDRINRMGRAMNATLLLSTQLLGDVGTEIESLIGTRIVFGQETDAQCREVLPVLGLEPTERMIRTVRAFTAGRCLIRGIDDRVASIQIDCADPELLAILDTNPREHEPAPAVELAA